MEKIRVSVGTARQLGLKPCNSKVKMETAYLLTYHEGRCSANCQFCAQARESFAPTDRIARGVYPKFNLKEVANKLKIAAKDGEIKRACIQTLNHTCLIEDLSTLIESLSDAGIQISLSKHPSNYEELKYLKRLGVTRLTIPLDAVTEELFDKIKGEGVGSPYRWEKHWEGLKLAFRVFGKGGVGTHIILGLGETEKEALETISALLKIGVGVGLFAFVPISGTALSDAPRPSIESYRKVQLGHYLLRKKLVNFSDFSFKGGKIRDFGPPKDRLYAIIEGGDPFITSGCSNCNRPYSTESPSGPIYNYAMPPSKHEIEKIKSQLGVK